MIAKYAARIDPSATALTGRVHDYEDTPSVHVYYDTASTKAGITSVSERLEGQTIAIIGVGGTGSYVLDLVAKTRVKEIRLYDGDTFIEHNAFRAPGAAKESDVFAIPPHKKALYFQSQYSQMHRNIVAYPHDVVDLPQDFSSVDFVFICIDKATPKRRIVQQLTELNKPFVDVGMSITLEGSTLGGAMRTVLSTGACRNARHGISFNDTENDYSLNIQIADLNALNAALAVIMWKKHMGFYQASGNMYSSVYTVNFNRIDNGGCIEN